MPIADHQIYIPLEKVLTAFVTVISWIFAWVLIKCLDVISKFDEDCFI